MQLTLGLRPYIPIMCDGMRTLPPRSVPKPSLLAPRAMRTASPPVEPPGVYPGSYGFVVSPHRGLSVSDHMML